MKIIHTADLHLASALTSRLSADKRRIRQDELFDTFERTVNEGRRLGASVIIIAGDLFDKKQVTKSKIKSVLSVIGEAEDITFLYLEGNHESDALTRSGLELPENLLVFGEEWTGFTVGDVCFVGRSRLTEDLGDGLVTDPDRKNIAVLHGVLGAHSDGKEIIGRAELTGRGLDYVALGHYHAYSETMLDDGCPAVYCGTPEGRGFDEVGERGFVLIDTDGRRLSYRFVPIAQRQVRWEKIDVTGCEDGDGIKAKVREAIKDIPSSDLVRLELVGQRPVDLIADTETLKRTLDSRFFYLDEIKDSTKAVIDPEKYRYDKTLKGEFIRLVSEDGSLSDEEKAEIIRCGITALMGEDVTV